MCVYLALMSTTLRAVRKVDHRIVTVEQGQQRLTGSVKELSTLLKSKECKALSIKGSTYEVKCACSIVIKKVWN